MTKISCPSNKIQKNVTQINTSITHAIINQINYLLINTKSLDNVPALAFGARM